MITVPSQVTNKLNQNTNIEIGVGATIDINCNTLVSFEEDDFTGANYYINLQGAQPYKMLFPIESIVKPFRPEKCGIKYAIHKDMIIHEYNNPRGPSYTTKLGVSHRLYHPSKNLYYKYFVTRKNENADFTVRYFNSSAGISAYNKSVPANKIVLKFELAHCTPTSWSIFVNGTDVTASMSKTIPADGVISIYYNGTTWSRTESTLNYDAQVTINTLRVTAANPGQFSYPNPAPTGEYQDFPDPIVVDRYIGVIEVAPHWVKDITSKIVSFSINKEASSTSNDILPVGFPTANSLEMELNSFGNNNILFRSYLAESSTQIDNSYIYMVKKAEIKPYYKIYDSSGTSSDSKGAYFKVNQGSFYLDNWKLSEHGELTLFALDAAKFLQETICPDILCDGYSVTAVIRRVLDSIGFTNYQINTAENDNSIIDLKWWWSDGTKTVWSVIQEICYDTQMSALFDENNILQFYTRDFVFIEKALDPSDWTFRDQASGNILPNLVSLEMDTIPATNNIKIIYNNYFVAAGEQSNKSLADIDQTSFAAAALRQDLPSTTGAGGYVELDVISDPSISNLVETLQSYSGFLLINSEIIEYDAIQYSYKKLSDNSLIVVDITGPSDLAKYRADARALGPGAEVAFETTGLYRIKKRGAAGTKVVSHPKSPDGLPPGWQVYTDGILTAGFGSSGNFNGGNQFDENDYTEFIRLPGGRIVT